MRVLLTEDDSLIGEGLSAALVEEGFSVNWAEDGETAYASLRAESYDLMILDLSLPGMDGLEVLQKAREHKVDVPVLILTARDQIEDRVKGLDGGADDYLVKPFDLDELLARVRSLLRRQSGRRDPIIRHGDLEMNPASHTVTLKSKQVSLSPREYAILHMLLERVGRVMSRNQLEDGLYSWNQEVESNTVEVHIHYLRKKLGADLIRTIRGVGYIIDHLVP